MDQPSEHEPVGDTAESHHNHDQQYNTSGSDNCCFIMKSHPKTWQAETTAPDFVDQVHGKGGTVQSGHEDTHTQLE